MSLDLDALRDRALPMRDGFYHVVGYYRAFRREDFDALLAEVERLRGERDHYRRAMEYADAEAERLREQLRSDEARRLQLLDDAGGLENEVRELRGEVERLRANHDGLVTTTMEREEFLCAAVEEENRGRCDDRNAVIKYLRVCGHYEAADAISLCGHPLYLCLPAVYIRPASKQ